MKNDLPKKNIEEGDDLKFAPFASRVAQGIMNYSQDETFILSLEGEWGSGKTTLINFIKNEINNSDKKDKYKIIHFNPWLLTDINQVIKLFFDELMKIILSITTDAKKDEFKKDVKKFIAAIAPDIVSIGVSDVAKVKYNIAKRLEDNNKDNLEKIKEKINSYLKDLDKKIIIIIDDIDRLTDKETEFIFRLTKGIADFDNLIYILLYDKNVVSKSLQEFKSENGQKYLEKIVQYSLSVPKPHKVTIKNLLSKELDKILKKLEDENVKYVYQVERWNEVYQVVSDYIKTVRDINQIVNIISFEYPIIAEEVNFTDFFIISLIRLKNHSLYEYIQNHPDDFFINTTRGYSKKQEPNRIKENFDNNLKDFHDFRNLLEISFPLFSKYNYRNSGSHKTKYIDNIYYFENYFSFSTSDDKISMKEYNKIKEEFISDDFETFKELILAADKNQKSSYFLDMYYEFDEPIDEHEIKNAFLNTLKISTELKSKDKALMSMFSVSISFEKLGYDILRKSEDVDKLLLTFYKTNEEIPFKIKIDLLKKINEETSQIHSDKKLNISTDVLVELNNIVNTKLEAITLENMLIDKELSNLIYRFEFFEATLDNLAKEVNEFIFISTDNFFKILDIFQTYSIVNGTYKNYKMSKESLGKLVSIDKIEEYIKDLNLSILTDEQNTLLDYWHNGDKW